MIQGLLLILTILFFCGRLVHARAVEGWPDKKLLAQSDLVAIVQPLENEPNADKLDWPAFAHGVSTTFKVLLSLKGAPSDGKIVVKHFIFKDAIPPNAGELINFLPGPLQLKATIEREGKKEDWNFGLVTPRWLAFLKRNSDGTFAPTSGQVDPNFSFEELHETCMYGTIFVPGP